MDPTSLLSSALPPFPFSSSLPSTSRLPLSLFSSFIPCPSLASDLVQLCLVGPEGTPSGEGLLLMGQTTDYLLQFSTSVIFN